MCRVKWESLRIPETKGNVKKGKREGHWYSLTAEWPLASHQDRRQKDQYFQRQKAHHLLRVRFFVKLTPFKVQILTFIGTFQGPGKDLSNVPREYYISVNYGKGLITVVR